MITARNVDVGALISAGGSGYGVSSATLGGDTSNSGSSGAASSSVNPSTGGAQGGQIFAMATLDPLRILVSVPEAYSASVHIGQRASVSFQVHAREACERAASRERPRLSILIAAPCWSRCMFRNPHVQIPPGHVCRCQFRRSQNPSRRSWCLAKPSSFAAENNGSGGRRQPCSLRAYPDRTRLRRADTEITAGLKAGDVVVRNVNDEIQENAEVQPVFAKQAPKKSQPAKLTSGPGRKAVTETRAKPRAAQKSK